MGRCRRATSARPAGPSAIRLGTGGPTCGGPQGLDNCPARPTRGACLALSRPCGWWLRWREASPPAPSACRSGCLPPEPRQGVGGTMPALPGARSHILGSLQPLWWPLAGGKAPDQGRVWKKKPEHTVARSAPRPYAPQAGPRRRKLLESQFRRPRGSPPAGSACRVLARLFLVFAP